MERMIRSSSAKIVERYVASPVDELKYKLGVGYGSDMSLYPTPEGRWNFRLSGRYGHKASDDEKLIERLKKAGAKYITKRYGDLLFFYDLSADETRYKEEKEKAKKDYLDQLSAIDVTQYKPDDKTLTKLADYRDRGSMVNVKAIKDDNKLLTYYYGAKMLGWESLAENIFNALKFKNYDDEMHAIAHQVKQDDRLADARTEDEIELNIPSSNGLFTFDQRKPSGKVSCWLPNSFLQYLIKNNIPVHFGKRTSGSKWDHNGRQWSEVEHLTVFPGTSDEFDYEIVVHTDEGGGSDRYTSGNTDERVSAKALVDGFDRYLRREGLLK